MSCKHPLSSCRCRGGVACAREGDEEGVALGVDLLASVSVKGTTQQPLVLGQGLLVTHAPKALQQLR